MKRLIGLAHGFPSTVEFCNQNSKGSLGLVAKAIKHKHCFIQFFAVTGILLVSIRSLGQKYRIYNLKEDTAVLEQERESLTNRMRHIKQSLLHEASIEPTGLFASRLRRLFGKDD